MLFLSALPLSQAFVQVKREPHLLIVENGSVTLSIDRQTGRYDLNWRDATRLGELYGEAKLSDGSLRRTADYETHEIGPKDVRNVRDAFGSGVEVTVHHRKPNEPELRQVFWVYTKRPEVFVRLDAVDTRSLGSNYLAPVVGNGSLRVPHKNPLQALFVPYDNDMYFRYRSDGWGEGEGDGDGSYEVGAVYDAGTRHGLVVGSIEHEVWKSAVRFKRDKAGEVVGVRAFAGVTSKYTHDSQPHGTVSGTEVKSPRMVIGWYGDWRDGMERFGDLNALVKPPLAWSGPVPFGWNSWAGHKAKLNAEHARAATEFVQKELPGFRDGGTAYINFDSFWDNLKREERAEFVKRAHDAGLKAGIYWTPFVCWGRLTDHVNGPNDPLTYGDLALRDEKGEPLPKLDGAYALDPTHPGLLAHIDRRMAEFAAQGYDFIKLDFMSHGALEGRHHDPAVTTGNAAYAVGMRRVLAAVSPEKIGRPFFVSLSIAPMFPQGYGHSRRISCDVFANIGASEYLLNSSTYGWWTNRRIYAFNDPDHTCVYQPMDESPITEVEGKTRVTASVVTGGMLLLGDDLTKPEARARVKELFTNDEILDLARKANSFRPVDGDSETKAGNDFVWVAPDGKTAYFASFNYDKSTKRRASVPLGRLGLSGKWSARDLWRKSDVALGASIDVELAPMDCVLLKLTRK